MIVSEHVKVARLAVIKYTHLVKTSTTLFIKYFKKSRLYVCVGERGGGGAGYLPPKNENFQIQDSDFLHIFVQNIDCGYALEPPR